MAAANQYSYQQVHDRRLLESICVAATVQVTKFDPDKMTVNVQPLSKHLENGKYESQPQVLCIPVACTRSGGFIYRPWIKVGDVGLVVYLDHDMDSTVTGGKEAVPATERNHATTDAVYIGGLVSGSYTVQGLPEKAHVIAKEDGTIYVAVTEEKVEIKNTDATVAEFKADSIDIKTGTLNITTTADVNITAAGNVNEKGAKINLN